MKFQINNEIAGKNYRVIPNYIIIIKISISDV